MHSHTATIGGEPRTLQDFSGFKAFKAMRLVKEILGSSDRISSAVAEHRRRYQADHTIELDRATALFRYGTDLAHLTDEDWQAAGHKIRIPADPSPIESGMAAFPVALEVAEEQTLRLLALVLASNRELEEWDDEGKVDGKLEERRKKLPHQALAHELLALAGATVELLSDQFGDTIAELEESEKVGKLLEFLELRQPKKPASTETPETPKPDEQAADGEPSPTSPAESDSPKPDSSTSSPPGTTGTSGPSSTEPVGAGSPSSVT